MVGTVLEEEGGRFFQNVGIYLRNYTTPHPKKNLNFVNNLIIKDDVVSFADKKAKHLEY